MAEHELLRLATAGSVDDGKSTLIGRLLHDTRSVPADQLAAVTRASAQHGGRLNLALLTDGLRAEREQGITIDVAYRYFTTPKRKFIIADTPGHIQYTRNMVTGASTADLALILVDARSGVVEQTRRHAFVASLLGISHVVVCVNKMDLADWSSAAFDEIRDEFTAFAGKLALTDTTFIPMSALHGDNVVESSQRMPWYPGTSLLRHLEDVYIASDRNLIDTRLPVQYVIRPQHEDAHDHRAYAGTVAGGVFKPGDEIVVLPGGQHSRVAQVWGPGGEKLDEAFAPMAVSITLDDDIDIARGDMLARPGNRPYVGRDLDALVCWFSDAAHATAGRHYLVQTTTRTTRARLAALDYRIDVTTLHRDTTATTLGLNDIGRITLCCRQPLLFDAYRDNRQTGSFILIDETTNDTVAAGMIIGPVRTESAVVWHGSAVTRDMRPHTGATVWLTGLSASGKSSIAVELERLMVAAGRPAYLLDGDNLRHGLNADLGFSAADRHENIRRVSEVAALFADSGAVAIVSLISPFASDRELARHVHADRGLPFHEVFIDTPLVECERRDPKGLYARARAGEITDFTGIDAPYERPTHPDMTITPQHGSASDAAELVRRHFGL